MLPNLYKLLERRQRLVLMSWVVLVAISLPFAANESSHLIPGGVAAAGSESARVESTLHRDFPQITADNTYVLLAPSHNATGRGLSAEITRIARTIQSVPHVTLTPHDREVALFASELVSPILLPLRITGTASAVEKTDQDLSGPLNSGKPADDHIGVYLIGEGALWTGLQRTVKRNLTKAEVVGFPLLLLLLLLIFGSLSAALLPLALGIGTVIVTGLIVYWLSRIMQLSIFVTDTASLIGIGVAVDYSLIILSRVRQELDNGRALADAQRVALLTSGRTVVFSGATVVLSLSGLWLIPDVTLRSMTAGATLSVAVAVAMAVTMLPALIWRLGAERISSHGLYAWSRRVARRGTSQLSFSWWRWTAAVTKRPLLISISVSVLLLALTIPAWKMYMSTGALRQLSLHDETRIGFEKTAAITGPGALGPIYVVVGGGSPAVEAKGLAELRYVIGHMPGVKEVGKTETSHVGNHATFAIVPTVDPESPAAKALVGRVREVAVRNSRDTRLNIAVGGTTAIQVDQEATFSRNIWKAITAILLVSFLVLTVLLRSVVLPVKAVLMNLLAVGAAYGVLVAVFQWGWGAAILGVHSLGHLETITPPLVLAIVFGLSMDYEIFLLSRIREEWERSPEPTGAVARGLAASAATISNAAVLMVCVFAVFAATGVVSVKEIGLGGAVAIGLDVTLIRLVLAPALMTLLGRWNWWWPRWLDRVLPGVTTFDRITDGVVTGHSVTTGDQFDVGKRLSPAKEPSV